MAEAKKRIEELEKKLLENVPIDTAKEIGAYQEKMVSAKKFSINFMAVVEIIARANTGLSHFFKKNHLSLVVRFCVCMPQLTQLSLISI